MPLSLIGMLATVAKQWLPLPTDMNADDSNVANIMLANVGNLWQCILTSPLIVLDYTRRIDQIQSTMDKSGFGTSMLAYDNVRGHLANTSLIQSPRGHTTGSGNAQHYMLACVLLIIAGCNCVRIW